MAEGLFSAAMSAFEQGYDLPAKMRARDAAIAQYGAAAEDPGLFSALGQNARAERTTDSNLASQAQNREIQRSQEARAQGTYNTEMEMTEEQRKQKAVLGLVNGLRSARDRGEDIGAAFDQQIETLQVLGVAEEDIPAMRDAVVQNPKVLDDYYAALTGGAKPTAATAAPGSKEANAAAAAESEIAKFDDVLQRIDKLQDPDRQDAARAIIGNPSPGKVMSGGFGFVGAIPGTSAADYVSDFEALTEGDIRAIAFETLKGGGQITEKESEFARDAIARLKRTTSYEKYQEELEDLKIYMTNLRDAAQRRMNGENVPDITGTTTPAPSETQEAEVPKINTQEEWSQLPSGTRYMSPDGVIRTKQ